MAELLASIVTWLWRRSDQENCLTEGLSCALDRGKLLPPGPRFWCSREADELVPKSTECYWDVNLILCRRRSWCWSWWFTPADSNIWISTVGTVGRTLILVVAETRPWVLTRWRQRWRTAAETELLLLSMWWPRWRGIRRIKKRHWDWEWDYTDYSRTSNGTAWWGWRCNFSDLSNDSEEEEDEIVSNPLKDAA